MKIRAAHNTGLAKVAVQCSADQPRLMVKIATFAKPDTVIFEENHSEFSS